MAEIREIAEGVQEIGADEQVYYSLDVSNWGSSPSSVAVVLKEYADGVYTDKTSTLLTGSTSVLGNVITLPKVSGLTAGSRYRMEIKMTIAGNVTEAYAWLACSL